MRRLSSAELASRLSLDYRTLHGLSRESLGAIRAFSAASAAARELGVAEGEVGRATMYAVEYRFPHLVGRGRTADTAVAVFDLHAGGNYPYSEPAVAFVSRPLPWSPHVHPTTGTVCIGEGWKKADGHMLLAQLVVHVARLMNFDEPDAQRSGGHWNLSAVEFWKASLAGGPYVTDLRYPRLPVAITHGVADESTAFREAGNGEVEPLMFRPVRNSR